MVAARNWRPGSFTKNFSWGKPGSGLGQLHRAIRIAFDGEPVDVERDVARERLRLADFNDFIPPNFFLLNKRNGRDLLVADELVLTALTRPADSDFDRLATFALNLSMVGIWEAARPYQRYPAEWAKHFVVSRVFENGYWHGERINAHEIADFISSNSSYRGVWASKAATNLNYIYELAGIAALHSGLAERWWSSAIYLALDRISVDRRWSRPWPRLNPVLQALQEEHVFELTAVPLGEGIIAAKELVELYFDEGGLLRATTATTPTGKKNTLPPPEDGLEKAALPVERIYASSSRQVRNRGLIAEVRWLYQDRCCVCGVALPVGNGLTYSEIGHIKPAGAPFNGPDRISNVLPFCPNHHRQFDRGSIYFQVENGAAKVVDRCKPSSVHDREFTPSPDHPFDMANLKWHADFFLQP